MVVGLDTLTSHHFSGAVADTANSTCTVSSSRVVMGGGEQFEMLVMVRGQDLGGVQWGEDMLAGNEVGPVACGCCNCQPIGRQAASEKL